jgi:hypothetical protein
VYLSSKWRWVGWPFSPLTRQANNYNGQECVISCNMTPRSEVSSHAFSNPYPHTSFSCDKPNVDWASNGHVPIRNHIAGNGPRKGRATDQPCPYRITITGRTIRWTRALPLRPFAGESCSMLTAESIRPQRAVSRCVMRRFGACDEGWRSWYKGPGFCKCNCASQDETRFVEAQKSDRYFLYSREMKMLS